MGSSTRTTEIRDASGDVVGYIAIDSTIGGRARGGLRMLPDVSQDELEKLARAMTLKYGFLGLPQGGAKGGVVGNPDDGPERRAEALARFARAAQETIRRREYVPDADMGTTGPEIQRMLEGIGIRVAPREYRGSLSGDFTAATVFEGARAAAAVAGRRLGECRVAIEGFGKVGGPLSGMFDAAGAKVVAVSTHLGGIYDPAGLDVAALRAAVRHGGPAAMMATHPAHVVLAADLKFVDAEIFCPCARHDSIREEDVPALPAAILSCGANHPVTPAAERLLWDRGVLCVPDFVANCGGVLGGTMEFAGWRPAEIFAFCNVTFRPRVETLIREARRTGRPLRDLAESSSLERFAEVKAQAERRSLRGTLVESALAAYREGLVPGRLVRWMSDGYFRTRVG